MRSFVIFGFLAATASAGLLPGYKYGPGVSGVRQEIIVGGSAFPGQEIIYNNGAGSSYSIGGLANNYDNGLISSYGSGVITSGNYKQSVSSGSPLNIGIDAVDSVPPAVHYSKQFYHFDAPEEAHSDGIITRQLSNSLKKNLQVVFIKAPENTAATNAALQLAKQAIEQKTAIYVLTKQNDAAQLVGKLQQIQENVQTKPEVRFVKYRTPEDVQRAKASIQSQYDNFGDYSETYNGGVAPVLNYASAGTPSQIIFGGSSKTPSSIYGSGFKSGSTQLFGSGSNFKFGSNISSNIKSNISSSTIAPQPIASASSSSESGSTQAIELGGLDSSSDAGTNNLISSVSYLPPTPFKK